jgi:hypothetical protein
MSEEENIPSPEAENPAPPVGDPAVLADVPPDRLSVDPRSPFFDGEKLKRGIGIRFKGTQRHNVEEYSVSEGWVRVQAGKSLDRKGRPLTIKLQGEVEAWYEDLAEGAPVLRAS